MAGIYLRLLRSDLSNTLSRPFIITAQAKGLSRTRVMVRHALRPSCASLLNATAINVGALVGGSVVVEYLFAIPGMGALAVEAVLRGDLQLLQITALALAAVVVLANLLADILHALIDPRVRQGAPR
jgi:peptide/nickel transport system permease protein